MPRGQVRAKSKIGMLIKSKYSYFFTGARTHNGEKGRRSYQFRSKLFTLDPKAAEYANEHMLDILKRWPINTHPKQCQEALRLLGKAAYDRELFNCYAHMCRIFAVYLQFSASWMGQFFRDKRSTQFEELTSKRLAEVLNDTGQKIHAKRRELIREAAHRGLRTVPKHEMDE